MKKAAFLFLFILSANLIAQSDSLLVEGKILSSLNYQPLENVTIILLDGKATIIHTDSTGFFSFKTLKKDNVVLRVDSKDTTIILNNNSVKNLQFVLFKDCEFNSDKALIDIKKGKAKLLLIGGEAPVIYKGQEKFEEKYKIQYHDFGCIGIPRECMKSYNKQVSKYLDSKYGKSWRSEVRKDILGIK